MKTLHLIRHAKSDWGDSLLIDKQRPLSKKGLRSCEAMAHQIAAAGCDFSNVFCSPAIRAQSTIEAMVKALDKSIEWIVEPSLYTFSSNDLLTWCRKLDDSLDNVVIIGHNPALTILCNEIANQNIVNMPTAAYAQLSINITSWQQLIAGSAKLSTFLTPKSLLS